MLGFWGSGGIKRVAWLSSYLSSGGSDAADVSQSNIKNYINHKQMTPLCIQFFAF